MELIAIENSQSQEKKKELRWSIYLQMVVDIESGVPKSLLKYKEKSSPPISGDCLTQ